MEASDCFHKAILHSSGDLELMHDAYCRNIWNMHVHAQYVTEYRFACRISFISLLCTREISLGLEFVCQEK